MKVRQKNGTNRFLNLNNILEIIRNMRCKKTLNLIQTFHNKETYELFKKEFLMIINSTIAILKEKLL